MSNFFVNSSSDKNIAYIFFKNKKITCTVGKNGIGNKRKEGDFITPKGTFKIINAFYRPDKLRKIQSGIPIFKIKKKHRWCTDPRNKNYNSLLTKKINCIHEELFRKDDLYDLILVLNYNLKKIKYKGSAIFIHCKSKKNYTEGCVAIKKEDLISITKSLSPLTRVIIS